MMDNYRRIRSRRVAEGNEEGFTLIELLIVIVVLGILAAVVVLALGGVTGNATKSACQTDLQTINTAEAAYNANIGSYTGTSTNLTSASVNGGPYLQSWPSNANYSIALTVTLNVPTYTVTAASGSGNGGSWTPGTTGASATPALACAGLT
jgi:prepilin-type N-terminal cleavage/methylation domain-containing protein